MSKKLVITHKQLFLNLLALIHIKTHSKTVTIANTVINSAFKQPFQEIFFVLASQNQIIID